MTLRPLGLLLLSCLALAPAARATTWYVDPAGGGDFLTIREAIDNAATRDTVLLARGVHDVGENGQYNGNVDPASLVLLGEGRPEETVIRGGHPGSPTFAFSYTTPEMALCNLTLADSVSIRSMAVSVNTGAVTLKNCIIRGSYAECGILGEYGSAIEVYACSLHVPAARWAVRINSGVSDVDLRASYFAGGWDVGLSIANSEGEIDSCIVTMAETGILHRGERELRIRNSRILGCRQALDIESTNVDSCLIALCGPMTSSWIFGTIVVGSNSRVANSTIVGNVATGAFDAFRPALQIEQGAINVWIGNNIIAFNDAVDLRTFASDVVVTCNLLWQNDPLSHLGIAELDPSNIIADPLFCDFANGDYTLDAASPATPENSSGCGLIGAFPVGCGLPVGAPSAGGSELALRVAPNPFNPATKLRIAVDASADPVDLAIFDASGRRVRTLLAGQRPGATEVIWDGQDDDRMTAASGVYFVRLSGQGMEIVERAVLAK